MQENQQCLVYRCILLPSRTGFSGKQQPARLRSQDLLLVEVHYGHHTAGRCTSGHLSTNKSFTHAIVLCSNEAVLKARCTTHFPSCLVEPCICTVSSPKLTSHMIGHGLQRGPLLPLEVPMCFITGDSDETCSLESLAALRPQLASWDVRAAFVPVSLLPFLHVAVIPA